MWISSSYWSMCISVGGGWVVRVTNKVAVHLWATSEWGAPGACVLAAGIGACV